MYIVGWKRLETQNVVKKYPNLVVEEKTKTDQWVNSDSTKELRLATGASAPVALICFYNVL